MQTDAEVAAKAWRPPNTFLLDNDPSPLSSQPVSLGFRRILRVAQHLKQENSKCRIGSCQRHGKCMYAPCRSVAKENAK